MHTSVMRAQTGVIARQNMFRIISYFPKEFCTIPNGTRRAGPVNESNIDPRFANAPAVWTAVSYKTVC